MARANKMKAAGWNRKAKSVWLRVEPEWTQPISYTPQTVGFHVIAIEVDFKGKACNPDWQTPIDAWHVHNDVKTPQLVKLPNGKRAFIYLENFTNTEEQY